MSRFLTNSIILSAALAWSSPASATWIDYLDDDFDLIEHTGNGAPIYLFTHDAQDNIGIVFVHGMGSDCEPDLNLPLDASGQVVRDEDHPLALSDYGLHPRLYADGNDLMSGDTGTLDPAYPDAASNDFWRVSADPTCDVPYWSGPMLSQIASVKAPSTGNALRVPTLAAGYNGKEDFQGTGGSHHSAITIANQINAFAEAFELDRVTVIAHSMGGLVVRDLLTEAADSPSAAERELGRDWENNAAYSVHLAASRITRVITIGSPQEGSKTVRLIEPIISDDDPVEFLEDRLEGRWSDHDNDAMLSWANASEEDLGEDIRNAAISRNHDASRSLDPATMDLRNRNHLRGHGTSQIGGLHTEWLSIYGYQTDNWITDDKHDAMEDRDRQAWCPEGLESRENPVWFDFPGDFCKESPFLGILGEASRLERLNDGMVGRSSATAVGTVLSRTTSNHHHNRAGDYSTSRSSLDLIGTLRFAAFADGEIDPIYGEFLSLYTLELPEFDFIPDEFNVFPDLRPNPPSFASFEVSEELAACSTSGVVGTYPDFETATGRFNLTFMQPHTPAAFNNAAWPDRYEVIISHVFEEYLGLPGQAGEGRVLRIANTYEDSFDTPDEPDAGVHIQSIAIDLDDYVGTLALGEYTFQVKACAGDFCSAPSSALASVRSGHNEFVDPSDYTSIVICNADVGLGGRLPEFSLVTPDFTIVNELDKFEVRFSDHNAPAWAEEPVWPIE